MTGGSRVLADHVPARDAFVTRRLKEAGAVLLGKLAMHEFAFGRPVTEGAFPTGRNPWDVRRSPAGSSSGSAVAAAAGLCAGALGSDTGGSIRGPAAMTALVGVKPTYGLVSRSGVLALSWSLDHVGPMTRGVWGERLHTLSYPLHRALRRPSLEVVHPLVSLLPNRSAHALAQVTAEKVEAGRAS